MRGRSVTPESQLSLGHRGEGKGWTAHSWDVWLKLDVLSQLFILGELLPRDTQEIRRKT